MEVESRKQKAESRKRQYQVSSIKYPASRLNIEQGMVNGECANIEWWTTCKLATMT